MVISEIIARFKELKKEHGDITVELFDSWGHQSIGDIELHEESGMIVMYPELA